jgi:hypothetical protein
MMTRSSQKPEHPSVALIRSRLLSHKGVYDLPTLHRNFSEEALFYFGLKYSTATASMVCAALGLEQKNTCRYKRDLEEVGRLAEVKKDICLHTGYVAAYLTTDKDKFPLKTQFELF